MEMGGWQRLSALHLMKIQKISQYKSEENIWNLDLGID